jgi:glycosyltransferase involved in cell wall biosynthesis
LGLALTGRAYVAVEQLVPHDRSIFANSRLTLPLKRWTAGLATRVVLNAYSQVGQYRRVFGVSDRNVKVITNSRPVRAIAARKAELVGRGRVDLKAALGLPTGPMVVCVARLAGQKDQQSLITGWSQVRKSAVLVLVGDGPDRNALEQLAARTAPGRIIFAGHQDDPLPWLVAADVFVLPSLSEGLPGALIEALAASLPCVATDIPGNRELVDHGVTGLLVPVRRPDLLTAAVEQLLGDPAFARGVATRGFEHVAEHYDEAIEREAWCDLFDDVCGDGR